MLTAYGDIPMAVQALKAGAYDFIEKPYNDGDLVEHLRKALESDETLRSQRHERAQLMELFALLTDREWEVMRRLVEGQTSKRIAEDLGIGERTVETHRQRIMHKLEVDSVADLVRLASRLLDHP
jgi:FixJ family two-component response regulator